MSKFPILKKITVVAVIGVLALFSMVIQGFAQGPPEWVVAHVIAIQEEHTAALMEKPGVVGTAVGYNREGHVAVKVFVENRAAVSGIPKKLDDVPVSVEVTGRIVALKGKPEGKSGGKPGGKPEEPAVDPTARFDRPVPIGVSTGHPDITAGTIGCKVTDGTNVYALSNNHVYADENRAYLGDNVLQPGPYDGGTGSDDAIGTLYDFEPINFDGGENIIDAAIALSSTYNLGNATPSDGYGTPKTETVEATVGLNVLKYGRTTSQTKGRVDAINATVDVGYDTGVARFVGQIIIKPGRFSAGGDSGSLVVVQKGANARKPVGLLFAGSPWITVANPIDGVLERFGVSIYIDEE